MVRRFLIQCFLWSLPIVAGLAIYILVNSAYIPAPRLSHNLSLNEQLKRIVNLEEPHVDVLAIGSSMTLNNLASAPVVKHFGTRSYTNSGAWGMGVKETLSIAPSLLDRLRPKQVIMVTNLMDFQKGAVVSPEETKDVCRYLKEGASIWDYIRHWDAPFFLRQMDLNRIRFTDVGNYEFLGFDEYGAATLEVPPERMLPTRYNEPPPRAGQLTDPYYEAFAELSALLRERDMDLFVIQSPYRHGLVDAALKDLNAQHAGKLRSILKRDGHQFVDGNAIVWPDSLFNDASHLNHIGSYTLTQWALERQHD